MCPGHSTSGHLGIGCDTMLPMITGKSKRGDTVKISTRSRDGRVLVTLSVIYSNGAGFADTASSIEEAKRKTEQALGEITWNQGC